MPSLLTTRVEIVTDDGRRASLDFAGWHSPDKPLLGRLREAAPIASHLSDPLAVTAQAAVLDLGVRIVLVRRRDPLPAGAASRLSHALGMGALHRVLDGATAEDGDGATARHRRRLSAIRVVRWLLILAIGATAFVAAGCLLR
ncbi:MAG TPA: hypothetical protein VEL07_20155 [Planctomycetota bacterium]|nr:hypothetical protein [Planctomycetota bacterium]